MPRSRSWALSGWPDTLALVRLLTWLLTHVAALAAAAWVVDGIRFAGPRSGQAEIEQKLVPLVVVAVILGLVTSVVRPVLAFLSIPFIILTLGLFLLVINAAMLLLTGWIAEQLDIGFRVTGFWPALGGSVIISVVTWFVSRTLEPDPRR